MNILYLGGGVYYEAQCAALERNGHRVTRINPNAPWIKNWLTWRWVYETGGIGLIGLVERRVLGAVGNETFDLVWVGGGQLVGPDLLRALRRRAPRIVNYNPDNPYARRDRRLWATFRAAIAEYDLVVTCRTASIAAAYAVGARRVMCAFQAADESSTRAAAEIASNWREKRFDVVFVGTWMPGRGEFLRQLLDRGVPLKIFGQRWRRAPEYRRLREVIAPDPVSGAAYAEVIARAKIAIGLLSDGNADLHTTRSLEIPSIGTLLCAKRTREHEALYDDNAEAIFWDDAEECALRCLELLNDESRIARLAQAGRRRALRNNHFNQVLVERILREAIEGASPAGANVVAQESIAPARPTSIVARNMTNLEHGSAAPGVGRIRRVVFGMIAQLFNKGAIIALRFIELPAYLFVWDVQTYGQWIGLTAISQLVALGDFGLATAGCNRIAYFYARNELAEAGIYAGTILALSALSGAVIGGCVVLAAFVVHGRANLDVIAMITAAMAIAMQARTIGGILGAVKLFVVASAMESTFLITQTLLAVASAYVFKTFQATGAAVIVAALLYTTAAFVCVTTLFRRLRIRMRIRVEILRGLLAPSLSLLMYPAAMWVQMQGSILLIATYFTNSDVVTFAALRTLARVPLTASNIVVHPAGPELAMSVGEGPQAYQDVFRRVLALSAATAAGVAICVGVLAAPLLHLWVGAKVTFAPGVFYLLLAGALVESIRATFGFGLVAGLWHVRQATACLGLYAFGALLLLLAAKVGPYDMAGIPAVLLTIEIVLVVYSLALHAARAPIARPVAQT